MAPYFGPITRVLARLGVAHMDLDEEGGGCIVTWWTGQTGPLCKTHKLVELFACIHRLLPSLF